MTDFSYAFSTMTVREFKAFKRALAVLMRAGISRDLAIDMLMSNRRAVVR